MNRLSALDDFIAPAPLTAVALMALNDLLLKPTFHDWLTGKLSDVAICFFLPLYVGALLGLITPRARALRIAIGAALTVVVFSAIKLSPTAASLLIELERLAGAPLHLRSFRIVSDPTDLLALPGVLAALLHTLLRSGPELPRRPLLLAP